ncbi:MAG: thioredoxin [Parcubacteria group bacterium]|nr:thioredoxin [Parcubacteria group bacterium]
MAELNLNEENFDAEVLQSKEPVMIDFAAAWCGPCKMMTPVIHELAQEVPGVKVATIDVDEHPDLGQRYNIMSLPTLLFFKDGKVMDQMIGVQDKNDIKAKLEELKA